MNGRDMSKTQRMEQVSIDKLVPYARNARTHSDEQILQLRSGEKTRTKWGFGLLNCDM